MSLHYRIYREEIIGDFEWFPMVSHFKSKLPFYPREISVYWFKWGVSLRWWFRSDDRCDDIQRSAE